MKQYNLLINIHQQVSDDAVVPFTFQSLGIRMQLLDRNQKDRWFMEFLGSLQYIGFGL